MIVVKVSGGWNMGHAHPMTQAVGGAKWTNRDGFGVKREEIGSLAALFIVASFVNSYFAIVMCFS